MSRFRPSFLIFFAFVSIGLASTSLADDTIEIKDLPKAVLATITRRYPKAELTEVRKTLEDKAVIYEVDLTNDKVEIEIAVYEDGRIDWVAVDLPIANLPKPVLMGVRKKYPAATLNHASTVYTVKNGKDQLEHYYVELTTKAGKNRGLDVLPKGEIEDDVEIEE
jgi:hypothetical protein